MRNNRVFLFLCELLSILLVSFFGPFPSLGPLVALGLIALHVVLLPRFFQKQHPWVRLVFSLLEFGGAGFLVDQFVFHFVALFYTFLLVGFLVSFTARQESRQKELQLRSTFLFTLYVGFITSVFSLGIYWVIPKAGWNQKEKRSDQDRQVGFTDKIDLTHWIFLSNRQANKVVARFIFEGEESSMAQAMSLPGNLLRMKVLDQFDGSTWSTSEEKEKSGLSPEAASLEKIKGESSLKVDVLMKSINSPYLLTPYSTISWRESTLKKTASSKFFMTAQGELKYSGKRNAERSYGLLLSRSGRINTGRALALRRKPKKAHLQIPSNSIDQRWLETSKEIFGDEKQAFHRVIALRQYLSKNNFRAAPVGQLDQKEYFRKDPESLSGNKKQILNRFFFEDKIGHCELYASSAALLLRLAGTPTRLVAGFKASEAPESGILNITQGDAHAWLEVWDEKRGWLVFDPTPTLSGPASFWARMQKKWMTWAGLADFYSARLLVLVAYIQKRFFWELLGGSLVIVLTVLLIWFRTRFLVTRRKQTRKKNQREDQLLEKELSKMESFLVKKNIEFMKTEVQHVKDWKSFYHYYRFGLESREQKKQGLKKLKKLRRELQKPRAEAS